MFRLDNRDDLGAVVKPFLFRKPVVSIPDLLQDMLEEVKHGLVVLLRALTLARWDLLDHFVDVMYAEAVQVLGEFKVPRHGADVSRQRPVRHGKAPYLLAEKLLPVLGGALRKRPGPGTLHVHQRRLAVARKQVDVPLDVTPGAGHHRGQGQVLRVANDRDTQLVLGLGHSNSHAGHSDREVQLVEGAVVWVRVCQEEGLQNCVEQGRVEEHGVGGVREGRDAHFGAAVVHPALHASQAVEVVAVLVPEGLEGRVEQLRADVGHICELGALLGWRNG